MGRDGSLRSPRRRQRPTADGDAGGETAAPDTTAEDATQEAPAPRRRRPSDPALLRSILFPTYWTRAERTRLGELARDWGMPVSAYVRMAALSKRMPPRRTPRPPVPPVNAQLYLQLAGVANNLNQLARRMNTGDGEEPTGVEVLDAVEQLDRLVRRVQREVIGTDVPPVYAHLASVASNLDKLAAGVDGRGDQEPAAMDVLDTIDALLPIVQRLQQELMGKESRHDGGGE